MEKEDLATRCIKYGDTVFFKSDGKQAFVSAHDRTLPQIRVEELKDAADAPPDLKDCLFQVTKKYQYTQKKALVDELARHGLVAEELLSDALNGSDPLAMFEDALAKQVAKVKLRQKLSSLFSSYLREREVNEEEFKQIVGESVLYGQVVQLRHRPTNKFVTIKRTAADVERGALRVVLEEGGQEGSWFQVYSGYRTKPEGAKLVPGEVVVLKGLAFSGNGLHVSVADITDPVMLPMDKHPYVTASKEVSASPDLTSFKVIPFSMHEKVNPEVRGLLCGMDSVSIQDLVANTVYINLLGAFNEKYLYLESPLTRPDPNRVGGTDAWRVELIVEDGHWNGMPLSHGCKLRLRHLPTGTYLAAVSSKAKEAAKALRQRKSAAAVKEEPVPPTPTTMTQQEALKNAVATDEDIVYDEAFRLVLTKFYNVPDSQWELVTFTKDEPVATKVYTFFRHTATGFWLSGAGPPIPQPPSNDPDDPQEEQFYPVVHPEKLERNVMLVVKLPEDFTKRVLDLQRPAVLLQEMCRAIKKEKLLPEPELLAIAEQGEEQALQAIAETQFPDKFRTRYPAIKRCLRDMIRWLDKATWPDAVEGASPHQEYQLLLRELGIIDLLVQYLDATRVRVFAAAPKLRSTRLGQWVIESGKQCHRVLQLGLGGSEQNQSYMTKHAAMVMSHLSLPLTAPDTLAAMYEDNMAQMQTVSPKIVQASVNLIRHYGHKPRFINFLRQICGTRERPMPSNQNWIVAEIMGSGKDPLAVFCTGGLTTVIDANGQSKESWVIGARRADKGGQMVQVDSSLFVGDLEDLTKRAIKEWDLSSDDTYTQRELFIYYCNSLKFIVSLCYGRNSLARTRILAASRTYGLGLEFDSLLSAVTNDGLPYSMRSYMVQVIRALYVDVEPYRPLKLPRHVRMLAKAGAIKVPLSSASNSDAITQLISVILNKIKDALSGRDGLAGLQNKAAEGATLDADELGKRTVGRNVLVLNLLKTVEEMFTLGMMELDSAVTQDTLGTLLEVIQKLDALPLSSRARFKRAYSAKVIMEIKKTALDIIEFALDMKSEQQCASIFEKFARWQRSPERQEFWARRLLRPEQLGAAALNIVKAAGGFLSTRVRAAASLPTGNKVAPAPTDNGEAHDPEAPPPADEAEKGAADAQTSGLEAWVEEAWKVLAADNEDGDFPLFKLDTVDDSLPLYLQETSPIMKLLDLVRYEDQELTAKTFQVLERLTSKREKLVNELVRTFVVTDEELITLSQFAAKQVEIAHAAHNAMGSLDPKESHAACAEATQAIDALTSLLIPLQSVTVTLPGGKQDRIFVSKVTASNCQYMLFDMQVHLLVLKLLKLPLKRKENKDVHALQQAEDLQRMEVFASCLQFLRHFMVVGDMDRGNACVPSHANQESVLPHLELLLSFLDIRDLPASDTIIALFTKNQADANSEGELVIRKLIKLVLRYGDMENAGWIELLCKMLVVDGQPIKRNQMIALQLVTQYDSQVLALMNGEAGLDELRGHLATDKLTASPTADPPVSKLAYHKACVQLLAECCFGKEPELVVKSSGYMSLAQTLDVLLLQPSNLAAQINLRYVQRAYWRLLSHCYFATDTDNTKIQVRNGTNRIWPTSGTDAAGGEGGGGADMLMQRFLDMPVGGRRRKAEDQEGSNKCLIQVVLDEINQALAEPSDALANADSANVFLTTSVFPAMREYFDNHWASHVGKLLATPTAMLQGLYAKVMELYDSFKRVKETATSQSFKSELGMAMANTRALLVSMPPEAVPEGAEGLGGARKGPDGKTSLPSMSQQTVLTANSQKVVQKEWSAFTQRLCSLISVEIDPKTNSVTEVLKLDQLQQAAAASLGRGAAALGMTEGSPVLRCASKLRLARLLSSPFGRLVPNVAPRMCFEELTSMLAQLFATRTKPFGVGVHDWTPELLVKLVSTLTAAVALDDGRGAADVSVVRNAWARLGLLKEGGEVVTDYEDVPDHVIEWRQVKYDKLGVTRAAVTLMAHPMPEVQLEALFLMEVLLAGGGNTVVQNTIYDILSSDTELCDTVFDNVRAALDGCRKWVTKRTYTKKPSGAKKKESVLAETKKAMSGALGALIPMSVKEAIGAAPAEAAPAAPQASGGSGTAAAGGQAAESGDAASAPPTPGEAEVAEMEAEHTPTASEHSMTESEGSDTRTDGMTTDEEEERPSQVASVRPSSARGSDSGAGMLDVPPDRATTSTLQAVPEDTAVTGPLPSVQASLRTFQQMLSGGSKKSLGAPAPGPVAEAVEPTEGGGADEEGGEEDELRFESKVAKLNEADNPYVFTKLLLGMLKLSVEGHHKNLQKMLQVQTGSASPIDMVVEAVDLLNVLQDNVPRALLNGDTEVADLMVSVCAFVQEMVQGPCLGNQESLAGTDFLASCNRIFGCIRYNEKVESAVVEVEKSKCAIKMALLELLMSLLEACPNEDIPSRCYDILDFASVYRQIAALCRILGLSGDDPMHGSEDANDKDHINRALERELLLLCSYMLKLHSVTPSRDPPLPYLLALFNGEDVTKMETLSFEQQRYAANLQSFLAKRLGYVELSWKGLVEPCYFLLTPECAQLVTSTLWSKVTLDRINNTVSPDSRAFPTVKAAELVDVMEDVVDDIELESRLMRNKWLKVVSLIGQYRMRLFESTFYLAVFTLLFQALADARWGPNTPLSERFEGWETIVLSVGVLMQATTTLLLFVGFAFADLYKYHRHAVPKVLEQLRAIGAAMGYFKSSLLEKLSQKNDAAGAKRGGKSGRSRRGNRKGGGGGDGGDDKESEGAAVAKRLGIVTPPLDESRGWSDWTLTVCAYIIATVKFGKFWYFTMLVASSIAGFFVSPFLLVCSFTIYFWDFDSGKQLVLAIQRSGISILNTFVLAVLAIYVFAVVTFLVFKDPTRVDKGDGPPCDTFYQCMGAHMLTGIMGDISALFNSDLWDTVPEQVNEDGLQQARTLFVLTFFMIWNFVLSNIFVGLIASAFEAIRDDQNTITTDRLSKCLICSQDMYLFNEKIQGGFDEHILRQHNALQYVFFLHHLRATPRDEYTGTESIVAHVLENARTTTDKGTWLPVSKSLAVIHANASSSKEGGGGSGPQ